jgi:catabolite regulation protein CreA
VALALCSIMMPLRAATVRCAALALLLSVLSAPPCACFNFQVPGEGLLRRSAAAALSALTIVAAPLSSPVLAQETAKVGEFSTSGLVFKDTLNVERFADPHVSGVSIYLSNFNRAFTDKLQKGDFFSDPSSISLGCVKTGSVVVDTSAVRGKEGEDVFEEKRNLLFKSIRVRRIIDEEKGSVIYVGYSSKLAPSQDENRSRYKSSLCVLPIGE